MRVITIILAALGLVALASSAPAGSPVSSINSPAAPRVDAQTQKYHYMDSDLIRCEAAGGGSCSAVDFCEADCFMHDEHAAFVDKGEILEIASSNIAVPMGKATIAASDVKNAARDASPQENKHYVCSKNRRSVLICRYGFCSTDHYCRSNEECKDGSVSCGSISSPAQASKSAIRTTADRIEDNSNQISKDDSSYACSEDRASVPKCTYGYCSTEDYCAKGHPCVDNAARC